MGNYQGHLKTFEHKLQNVEVPIPNKFPTLRKRSESKQPKLSDFAKYTLSQILNSDDLSKYVKF